MLNLKSVVNTKKVVQVSLLKPAVHIGISAGTYGDNNNENDRRVCVLVLVLLEISCCFVVVLALVLVVLLVQRGVCTRTHVSHVDVAVRRCTYRWVLEYRHVRASDDTQHGEQQCTTVVRSRAPCAQLAHSRAVNSTWSTLALGFRLSTDINTQCLLYNIVPHKSAFTRCASCGKVQDRRTIALLWAQVGVNCRRQLRCGAGGCIFILRGLLQTHTRAET